MATYHPAQRCISDIFAEKHREAENVCWSNRRELDLTLMDPSRPNKRHQRRGSATTADEVYSKAAVLQSRREAKQARKAAASACEECQSEFGLFLWKHSCHSCCRVLCDSCGPHRELRNSRLCDDCQSSCLRDEWLRDLLRGERILSGGSPETDASWQHHTAIPIVSEVHARSTQPCICHSRNSPSRDHGNESCLRAVTKHQCTSH